MTIGKHVTYTGHVQGVGFRYTVVGLAKHFPVTGYVRNLASGDVELVVEGSAEQVEAFLEAVADRMAGYIQGTNVREQPAGGYQGFTIRR
jgi:acylphosphatase